MITEKLKKLREELGKIYKPDKIEVLKIKIAREQRKNDAIFIATQISEQLKGVLTPLTDKKDYNEFLQAVQNIQIQQPEINVQASDVKIDFPQEMEVKGLKGFFNSLITKLSGIFKVNIQGIDSENPLAVVLTYKGKEYIGGAGGIGGGPDNVGIKNAANTRISPATEETLLLVKTALENLEINADSINLNTDTLEALIASTNAKLDTLNAKNFSTAANQTNGLQKTQVVDSSGAELEMIKQNDNFNAANHGIIIYGLDGVSNPNKYRQLKCDADGMLTIHITDIAHNTINPAKEDGNLATIKDAVSPYDGTTDDGSVALASANTWYAVPSGTAPTTAYELVVSLENADGTIRWSFNNGGTPGVANGNLAPNHLTIKMPANGVIYFGSSVAGDDVNFTLRKI